MRYLGNKTKLLAAIERFVETKTQPKPGWTFLDAFAGTGSVARHFRARGWRVHANDLLMSSYVRQRAYLFDNEPKLPQRSIDYACDLLDNARPRQGLIYRQFSPGGRAGRLYFSALNAAKLDGAWAELVRWWRDDAADADGFYMALCAILEAADRVANISGTYGAYLKELTPAAQKGIRIVAPADLDWSSPPGVAHRENANALVEKLEVDVLYLDPPYNQRQYAKYYHVPEVIASLHLQPDLEAFEDSLYGKTGIPAFADRLSDYCKAEDVEDALRDLLMRAQARHVVISYSNEGLLTKEQILAVLKQTGWERTSVEEIAYKRFKSDSDERREFAADGVTEFLFYGRR